jgi:cell division septation protein DedD
MIPLKQSRCLLALVFGALAVAGPATAAKATATPAPATTEQAAAAPAGQATYGVKLGAFFKEEHKKAARTAFAQRYARAKDCPEGMERNTAKKCRR